MTDALSPINKIIDADTEAAALGIETRHFCERSPIGRYLVDKAQNDRKEALEALAEVDSADSRAVAKLQTQARIPQLFLAWLDQAISAGEAAETRIEDSVLAESQVDYSFSYRDETLYE